MSLINEAIVAAMVQAARATPAGVWVECGVYRGGSAEMLAEAAREQGRELWLFDTFAGIPEATAGLDKHRVGDFADASFDAVRRRVGAEWCYVVGDVRTTLRHIQWQERIAFAHIDVDQYEATSVCILAMTMALGGLIWFDDYDQLEGARRAVDDLLPGRVELADCGKALVRF